MSTEPPAKGARRSLRIGQYQVLSHIATGGMGKVYKAVDVDLGREAAIKVLAPELAGRPGMLDRFRLEARHAAKLRHENIVTIYGFDVDKASGMYFLAMEFVDGIDLHQYILRKGKLQPEEARYLMVQAVRALEQVHKHGLVHRDIKPSNFLITRKNDKPLVKLTDLGLAREVNDEEFKLTKSGTTVGTVDYMSPEQARDSRLADIRSDIYSLGCTYFHMLAGQPPFAEGGLTERLYKHVQVEAPDVRRFNPKVSDATAAILRRMLEKDPSGRYQTPSDLMRDLLQPKSGGPELSHREVLQSLGEIEAAPRPAPKSRADATESAVPRTSGASIRPRYRRDDPGIRKRDRAKAEPKPERPPLIVIEGWKAWAGVLTGFIAVATLLVLGATQLGKWTAAPRRASPRTVAEAEPAPPPAEQATQPGTEKAAVPDPAQEKDKDAVAETPVPVVPPPVPEPTPVPPPSEDGSGPLYRPEPKNLAELRREVDSARGESTRSPDYQALGQMVREAEARQGTPPDPQQKSLTEMVRKVEEQKDKPPEERRAALNELKQAVAARRKTSPEPNLARLADTLDGFDAPAAPAEAKAADLVVSRGAAGANGQPLPSLAAACAAAPADRETVIEIRDNGPLFEPAIAVTGKHLVLRAAAGYRPLIAWDGQSGGPGKPDRLLSVSQGSLTLENLNLVYKQTAARPGDQAGLLRLTDSDFTARNCTFSLSAKGSTSLSIAQLDTTRPDSKPVKCRLDHCFFRGPEVVALDVRAPGADLLLEGCLLVNTNQALIEIVGRNSPVTTLRAVRSTLVSGQTAVRVRAGTPTDSRPAVHFLGWDSLLARANAQPGGEMFVLLDGAGSGAIDWRAVNCLYTAWQTLFSSAGTHISHADFPVWHKLWPRNEGDHALPKSWPAVFHPDPSDAPPTAFRTAGTHAQYSATSGPGLIGCNVTQLPPVRDGWQNLTYDPYVVPAYDLPSGTVPDIPTTLESIYAGERLDLGQAGDLGQYLDNIQKTKRLASQVVLRLTGSGEYKTSPIRLKGVSLVLAFEPPAEGAPAVLVLNGRTAADRGALIDIEDGGLEISNGAIRFPNFKGAPVPAQVLRVRGGDLRLFGCRLEGSLGRAPDFYRGVIQFEGSGETALDKARECAVVNSVLLSGKTCIQAVGTGARVRLQNSVLLAGGAAVHLDPGPAPKGHFNSQCLLENVTVAARKAVVQLGDAPKLAFAVDPFIFESRTSLFLDPFTGTGPSGGMVQYDGIALARGLLVWQGEGNGFDKRLAFAAAATGSSPEPQPLATVWPRLWGPLGERPPSSYNLVGRTLDLDKPQLDQLTASVPGRPKAEALGADLGQLADLAQLGIPKKPVKPSK